MADVYLNIIGRAQNYLNAQKQVREQTAKTEQRVEDANKKMQDSFNRSGNVVNSLRNKLVALFTIAAATQFIRQIIAVRSEFEKYGAVLKNTLGSQEAAARVMGMIRDFAARTPFSVRELTDAFVRLANQGFKPTEEEMRKLGDLAASTGKSFTQLAEAIIDAAVGEFIRLKEFGILASKEGDRVKFIFKGVETQVDFTNKAITDYILSLGDAVGISGAMAEISKTLGGRISNLGDSWDTLLDTLGGRTSGIFANAISNIQNLIDHLTRMIQIMDPAGIGQQNAEEFWLNVMQLGNERAIEKVNAEISKVNEELEYLTRINKELASGKSIFETLGPEAVRQEIIKNTDKINELTSYRVSLLEKLGIKEEKNTEITEKNTKALRDYRAEMQKLLIQMTLLERAMAADDAQKLWEEARKELERYFEEQKKIIDKQTDEWQAGQDIIKQMVAETYETAAESAEEWFNEFMERKAKEIEAEQELKEFKKRALYEVSDIAIALTNLKAARVQSAMDQELMALEEKHRKELISDDAYEKQKSLIEKKYGRERQRIAVNQAIISGSLAIMQIFAQGGLTPFTAALAILMGIKTAIEISTIKAQKFAKGVIDLKGKGSGTSDEIPAWLSRGESVMTAKETKEYLPYLKAMKEGTFPRFDLEIARKFEKNTYNNLNYDNSKEIKELRTIAGLLKNRNPEVEFIQNGQRVIKKGNVTTRINLN